MLKLVEIHDTDDDHETGGQDLPYLVTASYEGDFQVAKDLIRADQVFECIQHRTGFKPLQSIISLAVLHI
jgi:hypothetical protein